MILQANVHWEPTIFQPLGHIIELFHNCQHFPDWDVEAQKS